MIRVAVLGSSHVGAIKEAVPEISAAFPDIKLEFFAVPGGAFRRCLLRGGVYRAKPANDAEARLIVKVNGDLSLDLAPFDEIWVVGYRFGYGAVLQAWINGDDPSGEMRAEVAASVARIQQQFGSDDRITMTPAPYPALRTRAPGPKHEARMAHIQRHPDRDAIFASYQSLLQSDIAAAGYGCVLQPEETRAAPFATANTYLNGAVDFRHGQPLDGDLRHMNSAYGKAVFTAFAAARLGISPIT